MTTGEAPAASGDEDSSSRQADTQDGAEGGPSEPKSTAPTASPRTVADELGAELGFGSQALFERARLEEQFEGRGRCERVASQAKSAGRLAAQLNAVGGLSDQLKPVDGNVVLRPGKQRVRDRSG